MKVLINPKGPLLIKLTGFKLLQASAAPPCFALSCVLVGGGGGGWGSPLVL